MKHAYSWPLRGWLARAAACLTPLPGPGRAWSAVLATYLLWMLLAAPALAQTAPAWQGAAAPVYPIVAGTAITRATAVDPTTGAVFITGSFTGQVAFGNTVLVNMGTSSDAFVARYDPGSGTWAWARGEGSLAGLDQGWGIAADGQGGVYVVGLFTGTIPIAGQTLPSAGGADVFVAAYAATDGTPRWATRDGGPSSDTPAGLATDGQGGLYITGYFITATTLAGQSLVVPAGSMGAPDVFVAAYAATDGAGRWAQRGGGTAPDYGSAIAADGTGNVYVTGYFQASASFAGQSLSGAGGNDVFVAAYTAATGAGRWATRGGGPSDDAGYGITTDALGGVYVAGTFNSSAVVAGASLTTTGGNDAFVAAYSASTGAGRWAASGGGNGFDNGYAVATDGQGGVYLAGAFQRAATFSGQALSSAGNSDVVVAAYTASTGGIRWARGGGGAGFDNAYGVAAANGQVYAGIGVGTTGGAFGSYVAPASAAALGTLDAATGTWQAFANTIGSAAGGAQVRATAVDPATGAVFVTGSFAGPVTFGNTTLVSVGSDLDVFVARYDPGPGTWAWARREGGPGYDTSYGLAADSQGGVYMVGMYYGSATYAGQSLTSQGGNSDMVVAAYAAADGTGRWAISEGGPANDKGTALALDGQGGVYVTGSFLGTASFAGQALTSVGSTDLFVAAYSASTGAGRWATRDGGPNGDDGYGIVADGQGGVYVTGCFYGSATFAGQALNSPIDLDLFVAAYAASTGSGRWARRDGGPQPEQGVGIAADGLGGVYVTGYFFGTAPFSGQVLTSKGSSDMFVAAYAASNGADRWAASGGGPDDDYGNAVAVDAQGGVYVVGRYNGRATLAGQALASPSGLNYDMYVAAYAASTGAGRWAKRGGSSANDYGLGIAVGGARLYACGLVGLPAAFDAVTLPGVGGSAGALAWLNLGVDPLPVALTQFTAAAEGPAVRLAWATASEKNSKAFEVERSADGVVFATIGTVAAAGTTATPHAYTLVDAALPAGASVLYYRLRQVDLDGTATYSPVRVVALGSGGPALFPNPAHGGVATLTGVAAGAAVQVFDMVGRLVLSATADAAGTAPLALPAGLPGGVYVVRAGAQALRLTVE